MIKTISSRYVLISITLAFILLTTLAIGNMGASYKESNTPNYGKITVIADDNNTFSDLSRNMTIQTGS
jgi:hypothetical protein